MTFDKDDTLGAEGFVSFNLGENGDVPSYNEPKISAAPIHIKRRVSLKHALKSALKIALIRPSKKAPETDALDPYNVEHLSMPDDFVVQPRRNATIDPPLPSDYDPNNRWDYKRE